jgi:type IV secretory pathway VirB3-like protein
VSGSFDPRSSLKLIDTIACALHQVQDAKCMREPRMVRSWISQVADTKLMYSAQSLNLWSVD